MRILITGGAGFIGCHVSRKLRDLGHEVLVYDAFVPDGKHALGCENAAAALDGIRVIAGDINDVDQLERAFLFSEGPEVVIHLAAAVSVSSSFSSWREFWRTNVGGTLNVLDAAMGGRLRVKGWWRTQRFVYASSMSVYGEGSYTHVPPFELQATHENSLTNPLNQYALSKLQAEEAVRMVCGTATLCNAICLRLWNTYGPGQSLTNSETGVGAIFASQMLDSKPPVIYEDGQQIRDFVYVEDVADAFVAASTMPLKPDHKDVYNIGSGQATTVVGFADQFAKALGFQGQPDITQEKRRGDARHCFPNIQLAREDLGFAPKYDLETGLAKYAEHLRSDQRQQRDADPQPAADQGSSAQTG